MTAAQTHPVAIIGMPAPAPADDAAKAIQEKARADDEFETAIGKAIVESTPLPSRDEFDQQRAATNDSPEKGESDDSSNDEGTDDEADPTAGVDADDLKKAIGILKRDNVPQEVIDAMADGEPENVIAWAQKSRQRQEESDRLSGELAEVRRQEAQALKAKADETEGGAAPTQPVDESGLDFSSLVQPVVDEYGGEPEAMGGVLKEFHARAIQPVTQQVQMIGAIIGGITGSLARQHLRERFPHVDDADRWAGVRERVGKLYSVGEVQYDQQDPIAGALKAYELAAELEFANEANPSNSSSTSSAKKRKSQPTARSKTPDPKSLTQDERETLYGRLRFGEGMDQETARKKAGLAEGTGF